MSLWCHSLASQWLGVVAIQTKSAGLEHQPQGFKRSAAHHATAQNGYTINQHKVTACRTKKGLWVSGWRSCTEGGQGSAPEWRRDLKKNKAQRKEKDCNDRLHIKLLTNPRTLKQWKCYSLNLNSITFKLFFFLVKPSFLDMGILQKVFTLDNREGDLSFFFPFSAVY